MTHRDAVETMAAERYLLDEMSDSRAADVRGALFFVHRLRRRTCKRRPQCWKAPEPASRNQQPRTSDRLKPPDARARHGIDRWRCRGRSRRRLAMIVGYESLRPMKSPVRSETPFALAPVTLRPESRGTEPVVHVRPEGGPVSLAIEVDRRAARRRVAVPAQPCSGDRVASGRAPSPAAGSPLLLLMPAWTLAAPMHYILSVHDAAGDGRLLGEYRFACGSCKQRTIQNNLWISDAGSFFAATRRPSAAASSGLTTSSSIPASPAR